MSNRKELREARRKADRAAWMLARIEDLPRRVGQSVRWRNGVVWTRAGDDDWRTASYPDEPFPSAHVARFHYEPTLTPDRSSDV